MTETLAPYPNYRDPGLRWLDAVPAHWQIDRAKSAFERINVRSKTGKEELLTVSAKNGVVPRRGQSVTMFKAESYVGHKLCWPGDLVVNSLWAWAQGLGVARHHGIVSTAYGVYRPRRGASVDSGYINHLLRSSVYKWELQVRSKGVWISRLQLTDVSFFDMPIVLPPIEEQRQIALYLDHQSARVDRLIRAKQRLVALLTEQKQAVIQRAVTRGLDPDAPMKPSGVDWLGDVPAHWSKIHLGSSIRVVNGYPFDSERFTTGDGYPLVRIRDIFNVETVVRYSGEDVPEAHIDTGDVLVGMDGDFNVAQWKGGLALLTSASAVCVLSRASSRTT